ncbi:MAG: hypothetical protein KF805_14560 [Phycisphaeraceae bacterium]|nr:hypothetical protein [Phycisphaeraceae bacterium]
MSVEGSADGLVGASGAGGASGASGEMSNGVGARAAGTIVAGGRKPAMHSLPPTPSLKEGAGEVASDSREHAAREVARIIRWMHVMAKNGYAPTMLDFCKATGLMPLDILKPFGTYLNLVRQCGYLPAAEQRREIKAKAATIRKAVESFFGEPLDGYAMSNAPTNEQGVVMLFGMMARELGFEIELVRTGFPDCEAKREGPDGKWRRVRIEFEFVTSRFDHDPAGCDLIVCWQDDSRSAAVGTLEILELKKVMEERKKAAVEEK